VPQRWPLVIIPAETKCSATGRLSASSNPPPLETLEGLQAEVSEADSITSKIKRRVAGRLTALQSRDSYGAVFRALAILTVAGEIDPKRSR